MMTRSLVLLAMWGCCVACAPVNPSPSAVVGRWKVDWACGVETLELNANGSYSHTIDFAAGGQAADSGIVESGPEDRAFRWGTCHPRERA